VRDEDSAAPWVPGERPPLPTAETRAARKPRTSKKWDREILRGILGIWAILWVALFALVSLIERDRPDLPEFWKPFRGQRDLRGRRYCAFLRLRLASFSSVSALIRDGRSSPAHIFVPLLELARGGA
jgi:hypothetical protein